MHWLLLMQLHAAEEGIKHVKVNVERGNGHPEVVCLHENYQPIATGQWDAASD